MASSSTNEVPWSQWRDQHHTGFNFSADILYHRYQNVQCTEDEIIMQGNLNWMQSRETSLKSPVWRGRENEICPFGNPKASDSANLDSAAEVWKNVFILQTFYSWSLKLQYHQWFIYRITCEIGNNNLGREDKQRQFYQKMRYLFFLLYMQLLIRSGRTPEEALMLLVPEAYKKHPTLMIKYPEVLNFFDISKNALEFW